MSSSDEQARDAANPPASPTPAPAPQQVEPAGPELSGSTGVQERPAPARVDHLPPYRVLLHNDAFNDMVHVVETLCDLTPLQPTRAAAVMLEAHRTGVALVLVTHQERAELYVDQFKCKRLKVTIEPTEA